MCHTKSSTGMATMYARYKFVEKLNETAGGVPPALNQAAFWIGMLSCLGMCFVATFQVGCRLLSEKMECHIPYMISLVCYFTPGNNNYSSS